MRKELSNCERKSKNWKRKKPFEKRVLKEFCQNQISLKIVIFVQHANLGKIKHLFRPSQKVQAIYDWVGSLSLDPCYYKLCHQFSSNILSPEDDIANIAKSVIYMFETEEPVPNALDESITFSGHHIDFNGVYEKVEKKRIAIDDLLSPVIKTISVDRHSVFEDLMKLYSRKRDLLNHKMTVQFENEYAYGDGVAREAFSLFIDQLLLKSFEGTAQFVPIIQPEFSDEEYEIVGKILYHFFINYAVFPIQICRASLEYVFVGTCSKSVLLDSFFGYCSKSQALVLHDALNNGSFVRDDLISILGSYGIRTLPTKENVCELICKAAKNELITKPWPALSGIKIGFKGFFDDLSGNSISSLYEVALPDPKKVLRYINFPEFPADKLDEKACSFLHRFIEEADPSTLKDFLQFVSGSSFILPGLQIGVSSQSMNEIEARPISKVCIKALIIPRNIHTYHAFKTNMSYYLSHNEYWAMED